MVRWMRRFYQVRRPRRLIKKVAKELQLVSEGITDETKGANNIRLILRNLTQLTNNLAQLRGLYGTDHGGDGKHRELQPRHARLAVASAVAFIDFVASKIPAPSMLLNLL